MADTKIEAEIIAAESLLPLAPEQALAVPEPRREQMPVAIPEGPGALLSVMLDLARDPNFNAANLQVLAGMQERLEDRQAEREFAAAFGRLSADLPRIKKNGQVEYKNKKTDSLEKAFRFATYEDIDTIIRPLLQREGFALSFDTEPRSGDGGGIIVTGTLSHIGGHRRKASIPCPIDLSGGKNNIQGMGSAMSYGKRYTTTALLNLITEGEDDDGERGGVKFIEPEQVQELVDLCQRAGRQESTFVERLFGGRIRAFDEIEQGIGFLAAKSTLEGIIHQRQSRGPANA